jgi:hypothetical protein
MKIGCPRCKTRLELRAAEIAKGRSFETCPKCQYRFFVNRELIAGGVRPGSIQDRKGGRGKGFLPNGKVGRSSNSFR